MLKSEDIVAYTDDFEMDSGAGAGAYSLNPPGTNLSTRYMSARTVKLYLKL